MIKKKHSRKHSHNGTVLRQGRRAAQDRTEYFSRVKKPMIQLFISYRCVVGIELAVAHKQPFGVWAVHLGAGRHGIAFVHWKRHWAPRTGIHIAKDDGSKGTTGGGASKEESKHCGSIVTE
jgi:hypothetical protein